MATTIFPREHPRIVSLATDARGQAVFAIIALCAILLFGSSFYFLRPYDGMDFLVENNFGQVFALDAGGPAEDAGVLVGDQILSVDGRPVDRWGNRPLYRSGVGHGDTIVYELRRGQQILTLSITAGSYLDNVPLLGTFVGIQLLSVSLWAIGLVLCLFVPPGDARARLVGLGWLLAGIAMAAGGPGRWSCFWGARTTMEVAWCCLAVVFVAAHLYFPAPSFVAHRKRTVYALVAVALLLSALTILEDWTLNPRGLSLSHFVDVDAHRLVYAFFLVSVMIGLGLLIRNRFLSRDPDIRRQTGIIIWGTVLGFGPFFALTLLPRLLFGMEAEYVDGIYSILFLVALPLAYAYAIHQRKLLRVDFIINRVVVFFVLVLLILIVSILVLGIITLVFGFPTEFPLVGGILAALLSLPSASLHRNIQKHVNRILYGCHYDFSSVTSSFSSRLAQAIDRDTLTGLLRQSLARQMGIRQTALFLAEGDVLKLQQPDVEPHSIAVDDELCRVLLESQTPVRTPHLWGLLSPETQARWRRFAWAQLFVPIIFEGRLHGLLVLGHRSSGDVYSDLDVHIIANVAYQGALAYANVQLVETLRGLNQQLVRADEAHRKKVARDLHDTVLQQLFFIKQGLLQDRTHTILTGHLDDAIQTLRRTIRAQRPPLLDQGLPLALQGLVEEMQELAGPSPTISWRSNVTGPMELSDDKATALYRIAQEALANALKHADAQNVIVTLDAGPDGTIRLCVDDDGAGMSTPARGTWAGEHHYGLVGMRERATMIEVELHIASAPGEGTSVAVEVTL